MPKASTVSSLPAMPDDALVQLATRIPHGLHREVRVFCVTNRETVMSFVIEALDRHMAHRLATPRPKRRA